MSHVSQKTKSKIILKEPKVKLDRNILVTPCRSRTLQFSQFSNKSKTSESDLFIVTKYGKRQRQQNYFDDSQRSIEYNTRSKNNSSEISRYDQNEMPLGKAKKEEIPVNEKQHLVSLCAHETSIPVPDHSTPIKSMLPPVKHEMRLSEIPNQRISIGANTSCSTQVPSLSEQTSSAPSLNSDIVNYMGDSWLNDQSSKDNTSKDVSHIPNDSLTENNDDHHSINLSTYPADDLNFESDHIQPVLENSNKRSFTNETVDLNDNNSFFHDQINIHQEENSFGNVAENFDNESNSENKRDGLESEKSCQTDDDEPKSGSDTEYIPDETANSQSKSTSDRNTDISFVGPPVDLRELHVPFSYENGKRCSKKNFCMFCTKLVTKLSRHLQQKHKKEARVKEFCNLPKQHPRRKILIGKIRRQGNFMHNTDPKYNTGILITCRQQQNKFQKQPEDYIVCDTCKGSFSKRTIRIHYRKCNIQHKKGNRGIKILGRRLEGYMHERASDVLRRVVFPVLNDDEISRTIRYDLLIILMGNKFCEKYTHHHQHDLIRANLRLLGRLKHAMMQKNNEKFDQLSSIFHPQHYDIVIQAVRECAGFDSETQLFKSPSVASSLGTLIKKAGHQWRAECIKKQDEQRKKETDYFLELYDEDFPTTINKKVMEDQIKNKRAKKIVLPLKKDIQILYNYLKHRCEESVNILTNHFDKSAWKSLAEGCLILLQMFNRRRAGEIERILIEDFNNRESVDERVNPDLYSRLSEKSREYARKYVRVTIRGKLGRTVPALLDNSLVKYIETILSHRKTAGVKSKNPYVFGIPTTNSYSKTYMRACNLMRKFSEECGATMPETLRGTTLRKHIATYTSMLGMQESQVSDLANFMGHNKQIHKDIYRVPVPLRDVTDISQLLQAAIGADDEEEDESNDDDEAICPTNTFHERITQDQAQAISSNDCLSNDEEDGGLQSFSKRKRSTSPFGKTKRRKWTVEEKQAVCEFFGDPMELSKLPPLSKCQEAIRKYSVLEHRQPQQLKTWIDNQRRVEMRKAEYSRRS